MMTQSWMGTDFTNDDLVKESSVVEDYNQMLIGDTIIQSRDCYIVQMIPKPEAPVVWSKVIVCIDKNDFLELHSRFYDEDGQLTNTMNSYDIKLMHDRVIPTRFEMILANTDKITAKKIAAIVMIVRLRLRHIFFHAIFINHISVQGFHFFHNKKIITDRFVILDILIDHFCFLSFFIGRYHFKAGWNDPIMHQ